MAIMVLLILNLWCPGTGRLDGMHCVLHDGKVNPGC
jgi:fumarate reductase subunit D